MGRYNIEISEKLEEYELKTHRYHHPEITLQDIISQKNRITES